jgi:hypothetical protein
MKKEQEEEAAKRVAEERNKRAVNDKQSTSNGHEKIKQQEIPSVSFQPMRGPSPPPPSAAIHRPQTPPSPPTQEFNPTIYENIGNQFETQRSTTNEETNRLVSDVDVSSLLRQRKASSASSKNDDDDEWAVDHKSYYQQQPERRSPSPTPVQSNNNNHNEGVKYIARYSYQKSKYLSRFLICIFFSFS